MKRIIFIAATFFFAITAGFAGNLGINLITNNLYYQGIQITNNGTQSCKLTPSVNNLGGKVTIRQPFDPHMQDWGFHSDPAAVGNEDLLPGAKCTLWLKADTTGDPFGTTKGSVTITAKSKNASPKTDTVQITYNKDLYATGNFWKGTGDSYTISGIAKWNGENWLDVGGGLHYNTAPGTGFALALYKGNLYVGGLFNKVGLGLMSAGSIAEWDGKNWISLNGGVNDRYNFPGTICSLYPCNNSLIATGSFAYVVNSTNSNGAEEQVNSIAQWNGSIWSKLSAFGLDGFARYIPSFPHNKLNTLGIGYTLAPFESYSNTALNIGGLFAQAGNDAVSGLAAATKGGYFGKYYGLGVFSRCLSIIKFPHGIRIGWALAPAVVRAILNYKGKTYFAGEFDCFNDKYMKEGVLNAENMGAESTATNVKVPFYIRSLADGVYALDAYKNKIYIGGAMLDYGGIVPPAASPDEYSAIISYCPDTGFFGRLNGGLYQDDKTRGTVRALTTDGTNLYVGGTFTQTAKNKPSILNVACWNGNKWSQLGNGLEHGGVNHLLIVPCITLSYNNKRFL